MSAVMQSAVTDNPVIPTHSADGKFVNDGSLASVEGMLTKQAVGYYKQVMALGLPMTFDDVMQEMRLAYVRARAKWKPEQARFNTYCYTVAKNEFFRRIEKMKLERQNLGMFSIESASREGDDGETSDGYERYWSGEHGDSENCPGERKSNLEQVKVRLNQLSPTAKRLVAALIRNEMDQNAECVSLREIADDMGVVGDDMKAVKLELETVFGVELSFRAKPKPRTP